MQFVRIGSTGINLDLVLRWDVEQREESVVRDDGTSVKTGNFYNALQLTYVNGEHEWFERDDATVLRACLEALAQDIGPTTPQARIDAWLSRTGLDPEEFYRPVGEQVPHYYAET